MTAHTETTPQDWPAAIDRKYAPAVDAPPDTYPPSETLAERACRVCNCTDDNACPPDKNGVTCYWVEDDLCSQCAKIVA